MWQYRNTEELYHSDDYLMHYGVLGMKWRVHRANRRRKKELRKLDRHNEKYSKYQKNINDMYKDARNRYATDKTNKTLLNKNSYDYKQAKSSVNRERINNGIKTLSSIGNYLTNDYNNRVNVYTNPNNNVQSKLYSKYKDDWLGTKDGKEYTKKYTTAKTRGDNIYKKDIDEINSRYDNEIDIIKKNQKKKQK